jgi:hypothetical protein
MQVKKKAKQKTESHKFVNCSWRTRSVGIKIWEEVEKETELCIALLPPRGQENRGS